MEKKLNFLQKLTYSIISIGGIMGLIYVGQDIIVPIIFALLLSILLLPINNFLERKKFSRVISIILSLSFSLILISGVIYFLSYQIASFMNDTPAIKSQLQIHFHNIQNWFYTQFKITPIKQVQIINEASENLKNGGKEFLGTVISNTTQSLMSIILIPIYSFLILYYRVLIRKFLINVFNDNDEKKVKDVLAESEKIVQSYMAGLLIELAIVATINAVGFLLFGIKYAIFLGLFSAILNLIPYIGMLIASIFCMLITLATSTNTSDVIWVAVILTVVQFIDNNLIMPKVVSSKVKINALLSIIAVLVGGAVAGVSGMFLSIPLLAILKAIFDRVEHLKPWGMLLGDDITGTLPRRFYRKNYLSKK